MRRTVRMLTGAGCVLALVVAACDASSLLGPDAPQGVEGIVLLGPMCPVVSESDPCPDQPYQADIEIRTAGNRHVTTVRSGEDGRFRVGLEPGRYVLVPERGSPSPFPTASDQTVDVLADVYTQVTVSFDTGIR
jgi:hypothetical protein